MCVDEAAISDLGAHISSFSWQGLSGNHNSLTDNDGDVVKLVSHLMNLFRFGCSFCFSGNCTFESYLR